MEFGVTLVISYIIIVSIILYFNKGMGDINCEYDKSMQESYEQLMREKSGGE